jgi:hypothetical protein
MMTLPQSISPNTRREFADALKPYTANAGKGRQSAEIRLNRIPLATRLALVTECWNAEEARRRKQAKVAGWITAAVLTLFASLYITAAYFKHHVFGFFPLIFQLPGLILRSYLKPTDRQKGIIEILPTLPYPQLVPTILEAISLAATKEEREKWLRLLLPLLPEFALLDVARLTAQQQSILLNQVRAIRQHSGKEGRFLREDEMDFVLVAMQILAQQADRKIQKSILKEMDIWVNMKLPVRVPSACVPPAVAEHHRYLSYICEQEKREKERRQAGKPLLLKIAGSR